MVTNPTICENVGSIPGLAHWVEGSSIAMSYSVGRGCSLDLVLLWLWCRLAATAPIWPLAWELPYAMGVGPKKAKKKKKILRSRRSCLTCVCSSSCVWQTVNIEVLDRMTAHLPIAKKVKMILPTRLVRRGWLQYWEDLGLKTNTPGHTLIYYLFRGNKPML